MEHTTYERQANCPNGESTPTVFDVQPDEARHASGTWQAHLTGAVVLGRSCRPVYSVATHLVVHLVTGEDARLIARRHRGFAVFQDFVVIPVEEWDRRCEIGLAWAVRAVRLDGDDVPPAPAPSFLHGKHQRRFTIPGPNGETLTFRRRSASVWGCLVESDAGRNVVECDVATLEQAREHVFAVLEDAAAGRAAAGRAAAGRAADSVNLALAA